MKVDTELSEGRVRLTFEFDGTYSDSGFAERISKALESRGLRPVRYSTDGGTVVDASDEVCNVARAFKSALFACRALAEAKSATAAAAPTTSAY